MDLDRLERLLWILSAVGFAIALVGLVGELRGWWNDLGQAFVSLGAMAGVATGVVALLVNATKAQVHRVADGVEGNGDKLDRVIDGTEANGDKLDTLHEDLGNQHDVLIQIRDRL